MRAIVQRVTQASVSGKVLFVEIFQFEAICTCLPVDKSASIEREIYLGDD